MHPRHETSAGVQTPAERCRSADVPFSRLTPPRHMGCWEVRVSPLGHQLGTLACHRARSGSHRSSSP